MEVVDSDLVVEDTGAAAKHYLRTHLFDAIIVPLAISSTVIMVGIAMSFLGFEMPPALLGIALLFAPILILINYSLAKSRAQREFMSRFATANGYSFSPTGTLEGLDGVLFQIGRERHVTDVVSGNYQGSSVSL
jgi:ABC-type spermidine/putrescine transport system permease subunit II